jgi:hypothetical protein
LGEFSTTKINQKRVACFLPTCLPDIQISNIGIVFFAGTFAGTANLNNIRSKNK